MSKVTGTVEAKSANKFGFGLLLDKKWYNSKSPIECEKGDVVEFDDGGKNYVNGLVVTGKGAVVPRSTASGSASAGRSGYSRGVFPIPADDAQRSIVRQNSVTNAVALINAFGPSSKKVEDVVQEVLLVAREFEKYSSGDIDTEILASIEKSVFEVK